jgi:hypothetical protein
MIDNKNNIEPIKKEKKVWSKPKLLSGKEISFMGLFRLQTSSTGPYGTPS